LCLNNIPCGKLLSIGNTSVENFLRVNKKIYGHMHIGTKRGILGVLTLQWIFIHIKGQTGLERKMHIFCIIHSSVFHIEKVRKINASSVWFFRILFFQKLDYSLIYAQNPVDNSLFEFDLCWKR